MRVLRAPAAGGGGIAAPAGIHFMPSGEPFASGDIQALVPVFESIEGTPSRALVFVHFNASTVAYVGFSRLGNTWVFIPGVDARDSALSLTATASNQSFLLPFAIESPAAATNPILFISNNIAAGTPDTFAIDSVELVDGSFSGTAVAVTIAGANAPPDADSTATINIPLTTSRVMTILEDDAYFADITGDEDGFTFTYTDSKVTAIDTSINADSGYSGITIGSQVCLYKNAVGPGGFLWEMTTGAVLTEEFTPFVTGAPNTHQASFSVPTQLTAIDGNFALAFPVGGGDASGDEAGYIITTFPLDDI